MKKPHSVRLEQHVINKFNAVAVIKGKEKDKAFGMILDHFIESMSEEEQAIMESLMKVWKK